VRLFRLVTANPLPTMFEDTQTILKLTVQNRGENNGFSLLAQHEMPLPGKAI
jgi:hypothetical protein